MEEMFESSVNAAGDLSGVFEVDGETAYFYLYAVQPPKILGWIHVCSRTADFEQSDISIRWARSDEYVGLFVRGVLWAAFHAATGTKHGGGYKPGSRPVLPTLVVNSFESLPS